MLNQLSVIGYTGKDAELRYTTRGTAILSFPLAYTKYFKNAEGKKEEQTTWYQCKIWGERATKLAEYIKKGTHLYATGEPQAGAYKNDKQEAIGVLNLNIHSVKFLDKKSENDGEIIDAEARAIAEEAEAEFSNLVVVE